MGKEHSWKEEALNWGAFRQAWNDEGVRASDGGPLDDEEVGDDCGDAFRSLL